MKGSRPLPCALLICFAIATQVALGPVAGGGCDALDVPLLLLLWFALVDRFGRVLAIAGAIGASRLMWGVSTPVEVFAPLASAVLWIRFARNGVDPRDAGRRIALVTFALAIGDLVKAFPVPRRAPDTAIDDQLVRVLGNFPVQVVHHHPIGGFDLPVSAVELRSTRRANVTGGVSPACS